MRSKSNKSGLCFRCATLGGVFSAGKDSRPEVEVTEQSSTMAVDTLSHSISTVPEAIAQANVDLSVWEVVRSRIKAYQTGNREGSRQLIAIHVEFRRKVPVEISDAIPYIVKGMHLAKAPTITKRRPGRHDILAEFSPYDHHFGKLAWARETGEDYDLKIAVDRFKRATEDAVAKVAKWDVESWLFPVGSDLLHFDTPRGETTAGTPMDTDGRWPKVYSAAIGALRWSVDLMRQVAPVHTVWVPGNHDLVSSWFMVQVLKALYGDATDFTVDDGPSPRKYIEHGCTLLGLTHGGKEDPKHTDLPTLMASEAAEAWARTRHHEWHIGDQHRKRALQWWSTETYTGCIVRTLPSLGGTDSWHHGKGFISTGADRCAEMYLWSRNDGYIGHLAVGAVA